MSTAARRSHQGDKYQLTIAVHWVIQLLLDDSIESVDVEVIALPGKSSHVTIDDIVVNYAAGNHRFIQAKKNQPNRNCWRFSDKDLKEELKKASKQFTNTPTAEIEFYSRTPFGELGKLIEDGRHYPSYAAFAAQAPLTLTSALEKLATIIGRSQENAFDLLEHLRIGSHHSFEQWERFHRSELKNAVTDVEAAIDVIEKLISNQQAGLAKAAPITRSDVLIGLRERKISVLTDRPNLNTEALRESFRRASADLLTWPTTLPGNYWMDRPELDDLIQTIDTNSHSLTLLIGDPGCGKSALLARLGQQLQTAKVPLIAIKADRLPEDVTDQAELSKYCRLPADLVFCIRLLAQHGKVVVLIDQLDALADLVVQHSRRLRVLISVIHDLAEQENIHLVASCRPFEYRHDPQLRNLTSNSIDLALPEWAQVAEVLNANGIAAGTWNEAMRNDLRSPHALSLFLQLAKSTDPGSLLQGYQNMLDTLWKENVLSDQSDARRRFLFKLADDMANREVLWLPRARYDTESVLIDQLQRSGILTEENGRIGFRHQTLYEFIRARTFLAEPGRLTETVLAQQHSLRIRPLLWHALRYMRDVDSAIYREELRNLFESGLRPHIRILLVEFLGNI